MASFFETEYFMPHGMCILWRHDLLLLHVVSDVLTGIAYYSVGAALIFFILKRGDIPYKWFFIPFGTLIFISCGTTHFLAAWTFWNPDYGVEGIIKAVTAISSVITAAILWRLMPKILALPGPALLEDKNRELQHAMERAEGANLAKSTFLANMSHELRTPLNSILGFTQIIQRDPDITAEQIENLGIVQRSGEHLLDLINDILDMSKIEAGRTTLDKEDFDFHHTLQILEKMMGVRAESKGLEFIVERAANLPRYIRSDERKLRQVLVNLVGNSIKFTEEGGVRLKASLAGGRPSVAEAGLQSLRFEIEDTGPGIAPEEIGRIFEPFVQTRPEEQSLEGTGLGLPISRRFVELMGGEIRVSSEIGQGSVFEFHIEVEPAAGAGRETKESALRVIGLAPGQPKRRILIVDDRQDSRALMRKLLQPVGFEVLEAANGQEAIEQQERWHPHLIWMDMRMPVMDGYEATRRIKAGAGEGAPVIIGLTASAFEEDREHVLAAGCDGFIRKPFRDAEIFEAMGRHLEIEYLYKSDGAAASPPPEQKAAKVLTPAVLAELPRDLLTDLEKAALDLDTNLILATIERIRELNPAAGEALAKLAKDFRYDELLSIIKGGPT